MGEILLASGVPTAVIQAGVVLGDGSPLVLDTRSATPTYAVAEGVSEVTIDVETGHPVWKWTMLAALVVALYLALPMERRDPEGER